MQIFIYFFFFFIHYLSSDIYKVVEFIKTKEVELVPSVWIWNGVCLWPHLKGMSLYSAIKQQVTPSQDWVSWEIRELFTTGMLDNSSLCIFRNVHFFFFFFLTDSYEEERRKVREAEVRSDLQSDAEEPGQRKVRHKM